MNQDQPQSNAPFCAICQCAISTGDAVSVCPECQSPYHSECWEENRGCAVYGCPRVPPTEAREAVEVPASYWGQEHKLCPRCNAEIMAAAIRCRHCGAVFPSAKPLTATDFAKRQDFEQSHSSLRRDVIALAILCAIPGLAALAAAFGFVWYRAHREEVKSLPTIYGGLCRLALGLGAGQTVAMVALALCYAALRAG